MVSLYLLQFMNEAPFESYPSAIQEKYSPNLPVGEIFSIWVVQVEFAKKSFG